MSRCKLGIGILLLVIDILAMVYLTLPSCKQSLAKVIFWSFAATVGLAEIVMSKTTAAQDREQTTDLLKKYRAKMFIAIMIGVMSIPFTLSMLNLSNNTPYISGLFTIAVGLIALLFAQRKLLQKEEGQ